MSLTCPRCATVAERQFELLAELAEMTIVVSRAYAHAAVAAAAAAEAVVADEYYQPETERARALAGAKDAADAYQKVTRSLRLTLMLQTSILDAARSHASDHPRPTPPQTTERKDPVGDAAQDGPKTARPERERREFDRLDRPYSDGFKATVNGVCLDIGATVDWRAMTLASGDLEYKPFVPKPPGHDTAPPSPEYQAAKAKRLTVRAGRPPPRSHPSD